MSVPVVDVVSDSHGSGNRSWSHAGGSGSNRLVQIWVEKCFDNAPTLVTYGGVTVPPVDSSIGDNLAGVYLYELVAPATGTQTVVVNIPSSHNTVATAITFTNVDQTTPHGTASKTRTTSLNVLTVAPSSSTNDLVVTAAAWRNDTGGRTIAAGGSETDRNNQEVVSGGQGVRGIVTTKAGAASTTTVTETVSPNSGNLWGSILSIAVHGVSSTAGLVVVSNAVKSNAATPAGSAYWASQTDGKAHLKILTLPASGERVSIGFRCASGGNGYRLDLVNASGTITMKLVKVVATVETVLATSAARTWAANERIGVIVSGTSLAGYVLGAAGTPSTDLWTQLVAVTDSTFASSGRWGLEFLGTTVVGDDWYYAAGGATTVVGRSLAELYRIRAKVGDSRLLPYTIGFAHVGTSRRAPFIIRNLVPGIRRFPFDLGDVIPTVPADSRCGFVTDELYAALGPLAYADADYNYALYTWCCSVAGILQPVEDIVRDLDGFPGWAKLMNLPTTPSDALDWLGQFVGVGALPGLTDAQKVQRIASHEGFQRGTIPAIQSAGMLFLTGNRTVTIYERDTSPYHFSVSTIPSETPYPNLTLAALLAQKPAGLQMTYLNQTGQTWAHLSANYATWNLAKLHYATWDALRKDL